MGIKVMVTGGCGYIGSHTIVDLIENGFEVVSADNFINSDARVLKGIQQITGKEVINYYTDLTDLAATRELFAAEPNIEGVIHFAALKSVGQSMREPMSYYRNNLHSLLNVLTLIAERNIPWFIFSSSCSVYGNATELPVRENTPFKEAQSVYAYTKQIGESMIQDWCRVNPKLNSVMLRYFNPAGAHASALIGELPIQETTNLVPVLCEVASGHRKEIVVLGNDYETRDGSCIRDYVHVMDLAHAHTKALLHLMNRHQTTNCEVYNLGIGQGVTVLEAIHAFEEATGIALNKRIGPRRPGDVAAVYSDYSLAARFLGWEPKRSVAEIMQSAWAWEQRKIEGFKTQS